MKDTKCKGCMFSSPSEEGYDSCCEFGIPNKIKNIKTIEHEDNYLVIRNYLCRYGFSKKTYEANQQQIKDIDLKQTIIDRLKLRYYLVLDCRGLNENVGELLKNLENISYQPTYVSVIVDNEKDARSSIEAINQQSNRKYGYKIHSVLSSNNIENILTMLLDTNLRKNNTQYIWILSPHEIENIDTHIKSIQEIIRVYQPDCDFITQKTKQISDIFGLFIPVEYYVFLKYHYGSLGQATANSEARVIYYE